MFKGTRNNNGRPRGSLNKITSDVKELIQNKTFDLLQSIDIEKLSDTNKVKMLNSLLPYLLPKTTIQIEQDIEQPIFKIEVIESENVTI
jgi:hypothetical protein